jgi:hypothetical protein
VKKIAIIVCILGLLVVGVLALIFFQKRSDPNIVCVPMDHVTRTKAYCVLNPFRDREGEATAEQLLEELKKGNTDALAPYRADRNHDHRERYLSNESEYRITGWRIGDSEITGDELNIQYWVSRTNYPVSEEEVHFFFLRTAGEWNLRAYTAIY